MDSTASAAPGGRRRSITVRWGDRLGPVWWLRPLLVLAVSVVMPVLVAAALVPARAHLPNATVALCLAVAVALLSAIGTRLAATVAAVSAAFSFDIWFTRPYDSLSIARSQDVETTVLLLLVGLIVGQLAARNRAHSRLVAQTSYDLSRIHAVAEMVASGAPTDQVVLAVSYELQDLLSLRSCRFQSTFADQPGPFIERDGAVSWGALRWGFTTIGLPATEVSLSVEQQGRPLGRFVLQAVPGTRLTQDQLLAAVALADQAGAALALQPGSATTDG